MTLHVFEGVILDHNGDGDSVGIFSCVAPNRSRVERMLARQMKRLGIVRPDIEYSMRVNHNLTPDGYTVPCLLIFRMDVQRHPRLIPRPSVN